MTTGKYLIFGTGAGCEDFLRNADIDDFDSILGFVDNNKDKQGTLFKGKNVFSVEEAKELDYNKIIIASLFYKEIKGKLVTLGISEEKITCSIRNFTCSNFKQLVFLDKEKHKLKNKKISIISNYCWALFLYRFLDIEYKTPFVGAYMHQFDYTNLLANLTYYLNQPPQIIIHQHGWCYIRLENITILFLHERDPKLLLKKWDKRLERLNLDNLFIHSGTTEFEPSIEPLVPPLIANFDYKLAIDPNNSFLYSKDKKIITTKEPVDLIKWFNKEL